MTLFDFLSQSGIQLVVTPHASGVRVSLRSLGTYWGYLYAARDVQGTYMPETVKEIRCQGSTLPAALEAMREKISETRITNARRAPVIDVPRLESVTL